MKAWTRASLPTSCGFCGVQIAMSEPMLVLAIVGVERQYLRCVECAGEPVPANLPDLPARSIGIQPTRILRPEQSFAAVGHLAGDWKMKQAGREPGEED